jgi:DNA-binding HxlR family transcriptional regulator
VRAGAFGLSLLSVPLNVKVLQALKEEPKALSDLRCAAGAPPQTTMRLNLRTLTDLGILERRRLSRFPGSVEFGLTHAGRDLLEVARVLEAWLGKSPEGPLPLGSPSVKNAIEAFVEGWSSAIVRALAARPLSLTEISKLISGLSYPSLERRLTAMRLAGQIQARPDGGRGTPYVVTPWLRLAMGPIAAAIRWERAHARAQAPPVTKLDIEAAFLLALPFLRLPEHLTGTCRLAVALGSAAGETRLAGVVIEVEEGKVVSGVSRLEGKASGWAAGSLAAWLRVIIEGEADQLEMGGDCDLALALLDGLHATLFRLPTGVSTALANPSPYLDKHF